MFSPLARILRLASLVICLIAIASFALFVVNQTSSASNHQQEVLNGAATPTTTRGTAGSAHASHRHVGAVREAIDDAANTLTSPFAGVTSDSSSEWTIHTVKLLLALAIYGFGLGFLARVLRVGT